MSDLRLQPLRVDRQLRHQHIVTDRLEQFRSEQKRLDEQVGLRCISGLADQHEHDQSQVLGQLQVSAPNRS